MSDQKPGGAPMAVRRRRRWPWVLLVVVLALASGGAVAVGVVAGALSREETKPLRITYEVTGTAKDVTVTYPTWRNGDLSTARLTLRTLPWAGETRTRGFMSGGSFAVTLGASGGEVACAVTVDNGTVRTATASGAFATATCGGF
ncbi:hypothetical protein OG978_11960 [Streptomyces sp. NBC_01591]|uniref:hypothetical protein n=1 Tax=Streptomyces sp. NBC_01591 TaxID=2975888 RepID=UPI002DDBE298|nr:hypothetical protein [Streptomyces sp. NBC_01591]WSD68053.1 hypothetical protein OG978_11960 [Streptomyces sp. NBC_01591]